LLGEVLPACVSEPYKDPIGTVVEPRHGRSMLGMAPKQGRVGPGTCFSAPEHMVDPYEDIGAKLFRMRRQRHIEAMEAAGVLGRRGFRSGAPTAAKPMIVYQLEVDVNTPKEVLRKRLMEEKVARKKVIPTEKPNFYTNPPKRGGPGTPGVLLSSKSKEQVTLLEHICDDFETTFRERRREELHQEVAKREGRPTFYSRARVRNNGQFASDESTFHIDSELLKTDGPRPSSAPATRKHKGVEAGAGAGAGDGTHSDVGALDRRGDDPPPPFKPPFKHQWTPPEYVPEGPPTPKVRKPKESASTGALPEWRPPSAPRTRPVFSVLAHPLNLKLAK